MARLWVPSSLDAQSQEMRLLVVVWQMMDTSNQTYRLQRLCGVKLCGVNHLLHFAFPDVAIYTAVEPSLREFADRNEAHV